MRIATPLGALCGAFLLLLGAPDVSAQTAQTLPFSQDWTDTGLITTNHDWSGVPGIIGYRGDDLTTATGTDPQTILADGAATPVNVVANETNTNPLSGAIYEVEGANSTIAFQGSGTADAPHIVIRVVTTGLESIRVRYNLRDLDGSTDNTNQQVALHYRVGTTGDFTNVPAAYVADATTGPEEATLVTPVDVILPADANDQAVVDIRIMTTNAPSNDELVGIDDIQITGTPVGPGTMTIAEARAAGIGATVTVQGVVSRAKGAFTYFQDDTAGLAIRQTTGAFFDSVATGAIRPGTVIEVTGTLSEFRFLLQINQVNATTNDLASFTILSQGAPPAPQMATLAEIETNGEAYEAELVAVSDVTIAGTGTFTPATSYTVSDPSSATSPVVLRVPNAADTDIDGRPIPAGPVLVTAVVGQFHTTDPAAGYQLLVIEEDDITVVVAGEAGADVGALAVSIQPNPVRGSAALALALPSAGVVRAALYDVLGREVAVLAEGVHQAGTHALALDASGLTPGVYVLRVEAAGQALSRTLTVAR